MKFLVLTTELIHLYGKTAMAVELKVTMLSIYMNMFYVLLKRLKQLEILNYRQMIRCSNITNIKMINLI